MNITLTKQHPLTNNIMKLSTRPLVCAWIMIFIGVAILSLSAQIVIPLKPVPITLQSFFVMFFPMIYGFRKGTITVIFYIVLGVLGMPVFAQAESGLAILLGPKGGYLIGFMLAAPVMGWCCEYGWGNSRIKLLLTTLFGNACIYIAGLIVLSTYIGIHAAIMGGLIPFIFVDTAKIFVLSIVVKWFWSSSDIGQNT